VSIRHRSHVPTTWIFLAALFVVPALWVSQSTAVEAPSYTPISEEDADDLRNGGTLVEVQRGSPNRGQVIGLIRAPHDELFELVLDYETIPQWSSALVECTVHENEGGRMLVQGVTAIPWPLRNRHWFIESRNGSQTVDGHEALINAWTYVPDTGNINDTFGYWMLMPWPEDPEYTYVKYVVNADPGMALPNGILNWATRRALPDLISGLGDFHAQQSAEQGARVDAEGASDLGDHAGEAEEP